MKTFASVVFFMIGVLSVLCLILTPVGYAWLLANGPDWLTVTNGVPLAISTFLLSIVEAVVAVFCLVYACFR